MDWILAWSLGVKLAFLVLAGFSAVWFLAWLDRRAAWNFAARILTLTLPQAVYFGARILAVGLVMAALVGCSPASAAVFTKKYDRQIEKAAKAYLPAVPWLLYKAQLWQESRLDPLARSPAGAEGIAQFMPGTARDIFPLLGYAAVDRRLAGPSIEAGAYYMARLRRAWHAPRPETDRHKLALASYNAGLGNILAAQRACDGAALYEAIMLCLESVTGRHAVETRGYAPAIYRWYAAMAV